MEMNPSFGPVLFMFLSISGVSGLDNNTYKSCLADVRHMESHGQCFQMLPVSGVVSTVENAKSTCGSHGQLAALITDRLRDHFASLLLHEPPCESDWMHYSADRLCIRHFDTPVVWENARLACRSHGAHLLSIKNADIKTFINQNTANVAMWIGLNDLASEGNFVWEADNQPIGEWNSWTDGNPNNAKNKQHCTRVNHQNQGGWDDVYCDTTYYGYLCQKGAPTENAWTAVKEDESQQALPRRQRFHFAVKKDGLIDGHVDEEEVFYEATASQLPWVEGGPKEDGDCVWPTLYAGGLYNDTCAQHVQHVVCQFQSPTSLFDVRMAGKRMTNAVAKEYTAVRHVTQCAMYCHSFAICYAYSYSATSQKCALHHAGLDDGDVVTTDDPNYDVFVRTNET